MRRALLPTLLTLATVALGGAGSPPPPEKPAGALTIEELAQEYRRLRARKVESGTFDRETQGYGGKKHQVMNELVLRLGARGTTRARIVELMGEPDALVRRDDRLWRLVERERGDAKLVLVYCWRGYHDFAWFGLRRGAVVSSGWWFAYE